MGRLHNASRVRRCAPSLHGRLRCRFVSRAVLSLARQGLSGTAASLLRPSAARVARRGGLAARNAAATSRAACCVVDAGQHIRQGCDRGAHLQRRAGAVRLLGHAVRRRRVHQAADDEPGACLAAPLHVGLLSATRRFRAPRAADAASRAQVGEIFAGALLGPPLAAFQRYPRCALCFFSASQCLLLLFSPAQRADAARRARPAAVYCGGRAARAAAHAAPGGPARRRRGTALIRRLSVAGCVGRRPRLRLARHRGHGRGGVHGAIRNHGRAAGAAPRQSAQQRHGAACGCGVGMRRHRGAHLHLRAARAAGRHTRRVH